MPTDTVTVVHLTAASPLIVVLVMVAADASAREPRREVAGNHRSAIPRPRPAQRLSRRASGHVLKPRKLRSAASQPYSMTHQRTSGRRYTALQAQVAQVVVPRRLEFSRNAAGQLVAV